MYLLSSLKGKVFWFANISILFYNRLSFSKKCLIFVRIF